jgi:hypothetical protein
MLTSVDPLECENAASWWFKISTNIYVSKKVVQPVNQAQPPAIYLRTGTPFSPFANGVFCQKTRLATQPKLLDATEWFC